MKIEHQKIDAVILWCWRRLLRVPWTAKRSNQSILREINPEYSLEGLMLKLKLQNFSHLMWKANSQEKTLMLGKIEGKRRRGQQRIRCLEGITNSTNMNYIYIVIYIGWHHQFNKHELYIYYIYSFPLGFNAGCYCPSYIKWNSKM